MFVTAVLQVTNVYICLLQLCFWTHCESTKRCVLLFVSAVDVCCSGDQSRKRPGDEDESRKYYQYYWVVYYLHQGGYVFASVCLFVCLSVSRFLLKKLRINFDEIFMKWLERGRNSWLYVDRGLELDFLLTFSNIGKVHCMYALELTTLGNPAITGHYFSEEGH